MKRKFDLTYSLLVVAIIFAIGFIILLAKENSHLKARIINVLSNSEAASGDISGPPELLVGDMTAAFETKDLNGNPVSIKYDGKSQYVFYIFSPFCGTCMKQTASISNLLMQAKTGGYRVMALSLEDPGSKREKLADLEKGSTIVVMPSLAIQRTFRATSIPLLALVSGDGKVQWVHYGILSDGKIKEISAKFSPSN